MGKPANLTRDEIERFLGFIGYGQPRSSIWFVGLEEGIAGQEDSVFWRNVRVRCSFQPIMDLHVAHALLGIDVSCLKRIPQCWLWMSRIVRANKGAPDWSSLIEARTYARSSLGRENNETFLTELSPLPRPELNDPRWRGSLDDQKVLTRELVKRREEKIRAMLRACAPRLVVCDGWSRVEKFKEVLGLATEPTLFGNVERSEDGRCLILPFLGNGCFRNSRGAELRAAGFFDTPFALQ
jgi:hypothetical protein